MESFIVVGKIVKPQGVRGQVKVMPITDDPERFSALETVYLSDDEKPLHVSSCDVREGYAYMNFSGVDSRDAAESLRGRYVRVRREDAAQLPEGRYFIADLVGCEVRDENGKNLGVLKDVLQHGAADVYIVDSEKRFSFPAIKQVIRGVDINARVITVDPSELAKVILYED